jgi:N-ethylmaleimide reductase
LRDGANQRSDRYGGSLPYRARFPLEVADAVSSVWGASRVGYKISPTGAFYSMSDSDPIRTFSYFAGEFDHLGIGYLHVTEPISEASIVLAPASVPRVLPFLRTIFTGSLIANGGYDVGSGNAAIANGEADLIAFGVPFLANPDLPLWYRRGAPLNAPDPATFYAGEEKGYIDYPALTDSTLRLR